MNLVMELMSEIDLERAQIELEYRQQQSEDRVRLSRRLAPSPGGESWRRNKSW